MSIVTDRTLTVSEVADYWGCSTDHIYNLIAAKELRAFVVNPNNKLPRYRIRESEVERFMSESFDQNRVRRIEATNSTEVKRRFS